jgi:hypothetical protein
MAIDITQQSRSRSLVESLARSDLVIIEDAKDTGSIVRKYTQSTENRRSIFEIESVTDLA